MLVPPPTIKYDKFFFNPDLPKDHYIQIGFKDVSIVQYSEQIFSTMTLSAYAVSMDYSIISLGICVMQ